MGFFFFEWEVIITIWRKIPPTSSTTGFASNFVVRRAMSSSFTGFRWEIPQKIVEISFSVKIFLVWIGVKNT